MPRPLAALYQTQTNLLPYVLILLLIGVGVSCTPPIEESDSEAWSNPYLDIPGMVSAEGVSSTGDYRLFFRQWIDHHDTTAGTFLQKVIVRHRGYQHPTIFHTEGYFIKEEYNSSELENLFRANLITVEHRYFGESVPEGPAYEHLNVEQSAYDLHRIREALGALYTESWISTGVSKGGMTSLFYKYYFPEDVAATVAYVAPIMLSLEDDRSVAFTQQVENQFGCGEAIETFQMELMRRKETLAPMLASELRTRDGQYPYHPEFFLQELVVNFRWTYWSNFYGRNCNVFPDASSTDEALIEFLLNYTTLYFYDAEILDQYMPYYFQAATELGRFKMDVSHLEPWWEGDAESVTIDAYLAAEFDELPFSNERMLAIHSWLETDAEQIIYLYGGRDLWTSGQVFPEAGLDVIRLVGPDRNHTVKLFEVTGRNLAYQALERWAGVQIAE